MKFVVGFLLGFGTGVVAWTWFVARAIVTPGPASPDWDEDDDAQPPDPYLASLTTPALT